MDGGRLALDWHYPVQESPLIGDFVKYGGRGTGEFMFWMRDGLPIKFMKGQLIEDWELSEEKVVWHVRPGIYWQGRDVMETRDFVAEDYCGRPISFFNISNVAGVVSVGIPAMRPTTPPSGSSG